MAVFVVLQRTEFIERGFVKTYHGSQRAGDQVQFVLNHQIRRKQSFYRELAAATRVAWPIEAFLIVAAHTAKECAYLSGPWQRGKLVHGGNDEARQPPIDGFIHS